MSSIVRRLLVLLPALVIAATACGGTPAGSGASDPASRAGTADPEAGPASEEDSEVAQGDPGAPALSPEGNDPQTLADGAVPPEGARPLPRIDGAPVPGPYRYRVESASSTPQGAAPSPGDEVTVDVAHQPERVVVLSHRMRVGGTATTTIYDLRWGSEQLEVLAWAQRYGDRPDSDQRARCALEPPATLVRFPLSPGSGPLQEWECEMQGERVSGTIRVEVLGQETVLDATGRSWDAWALAREDTFRHPQGTGETTSRSWFVADLGMNVRERQVTTFRSSAAGPQPFEFTMEFETALYSIPG